MKKTNSFNPDNSSLKNKIVHASGSAGGMLVGNRHSENGIKAINTSTGQPLEMEGGEVVITRDAVSDPTKRSFNGQMLTNREILSTINESGGGVSFANGGEIPNEVYFDCDASYEYGGETMCGKDLAKKMKKGGGLSDGMSLMDIAKLHGVSRSTIDKNLKLGRSIEAEHTSDPKLQRQIALDHIVERYDYYQQLEKIGLEKGGKIKNKKDNNMENRKTTFQLAKEIRKDGEAWKDAIKRAGEQINRDSKATKKSVKKEVTYVKNVASKKRNPMKKMATGGDIQNLDMANSDLFAKGGSLEVHGLKLGDRIKRKVSNDVLVIDKQGNEKYINLATGERSDEPTLPFKKGGKVRSKRSINTDRARLSKEPWEQAYKSKRKGSYYAKGGKTQGGKFQVALHWKGLSKDRTIGKYIITEKTLYELQEQWSHIVSIDVLDNSNKKPISWFELKKELYSKGRDKGLYAKGGELERVRDFFEVYNKVVEENQAMPNDYVNVLESINAELQNRGYEEFDNDTQDLRDEIMDRYEKKVLSKQGMRFAKGGLLNPMERYILEIKGITNSSSLNKGKSKIDEVQIKKFIKENDLTDKEVLNIVIGLGRNQLSPKTFRAAVVLGKDGLSTKQVLKFASSEKALILANGGDLNSVVADSTVDFVNYYLEKGGALKNQMAIPFEKGGSIGDMPRIYVADLEAYNSGRLQGEWLDLDDYSDADELMEAIQELLDGWGVEEYAIHDYENIPTSIASEYMGKRDFERLYEIKDLAEENSLPYEVVAEVVSEYGEDVVEEFRGVYDDMEDFAYELVEEMGITSFMNFEHYLYVTDTDRRLISQDSADSYVEDIVDEDDGERIIEEAELDLEEYQEADDDRREEMIEEAREIVYDKIYDAEYEGLENPYEYLVEEQGIYDADSFAEADFTVINYRALGEALEQDYVVVNYEGKVYLFLNI